LVKVLRKWTVDLVDVAVLMKERIGPVKPTRQRPECITENRNMDNGNSGKAVVKRPKLIQEGFGEDRYGFVTDQYACPYCDKLFEMVQSDVEYCLRKGRPVSCGCLDRHKAAAKLTCDVSVSPAEFSELMGPFVEHRLKLARVWNGMNNRCGNPKNKQYHRYGGRGIRVLFTDFEQFFFWSVANGYGYKPGLQIDRIDNNADYHPANCRWVDNMENSRNTSRTRLDPAKVKRIRAMRASGMLQREIAAEMGVSVQHVSCVLSGERWSDIT
jgi:hypothetical protein